MSKPNFHGAMTALVTPFRDGQVDYDRLKANIQFQIAQGIDGVVPVGTTGESPTLSHDEHDKVIEVAVEAAGGKVPVIAGAGSNATSEALRLTKHAKEVGADACLQVNPYYNKPTQEGLYRHFSTIAEVGLPVILYNIPSRSGVAMTPQTVARLAQHPNIVGVKEATGSMDVASEIATLTSRERLAILSGDDSLTLPLMSIGGAGVISVLSNLLPAMVKAMVAAAMLGNWQEARRLHLELFPLCKAMFIETNPIPIKAAMAFKGMDSGELRLPMCPLSEANHAALETILKQHGVI
ncbi:MAG: 4-hydroxy-tetrahydrodipicolinate synthase [Phycisphaeraceae bacterium]|nr:4-hydroxy-tetrahydrodipicolinate synthase [Phycisphaeraceae bacterium]